MTSDKYLFLEQSGPGDLSLFQGRMIWQYNHQFALPEYWLNPADFDARIHSKELYRMAQDLGRTKSELLKNPDGTPNNQPEKAIRFDREFIRLGFRDIARDTDERTLIFSLLPKNIGTGNKIPASIPKYYRLGDKGKIFVEVVSPLRLLFALAWFNSIVTDWLTRFMVQISVNKTYLYRLPMPQPTDAEILENPDYKALAKNALLLTLAASWDDFATDLAPQLKALGISKKDVPTMPKAKDKLRADIDQRVVRLYGLGHDELLHLLSSFKVMASKRPEYLTLFH